MLRSRITVHLLVTLLGLCASAGNLATGQERTVAPPERLAAPPTDAPVDEEILPARIPRAIDDELQNTRPSVSAGDRDGVRSPAMAATLYILEADWSKSPTARQVEADLLAAFEGLKLTESQRADIVKLAPSILFAPGNVPLYTPSHASGLLLWLKQHGLLKAQLQSIARSERIMEDSSFDLGASAAGKNRSPQNPGSDRMTQRLEFLDKDQLLMSVGESDISEGPFITKKNVQQWLVGWESTPGENAISLVSSTIVFEQRRGEKDPRNLGSNHQKEAYFLIPDDHVAIVGTQEIFYRTLEHQMNNAPVAAMVGSPKVAVNRVLGILVLGKPAVDLSVNPGPTGFFVPDRIGTVKHERPRTRPVPQPKAGGYIDQSGRTYGRDLSAQPARRPARAASELPSPSTAAATPKASQTSQILGEIITNAPAADAPPAQWEQHSKEKDRKLVQLFNGSKSDEERENWGRELLTELRTSTLRGHYAAGLQRLRDVEREFKTGVPNLAPLAEYSVWIAEFNERLNKCTEEDDRERLRAQRREYLVTFLDRHPKSEVCAIAFLELGAKDMERGDYDLGIRRWQKAAAEFPETEHGRRAAKALEPFAAMAAASRMRPPERADSRINAGTAAPATPQSAEATEWEQTEMARFAGTWRVTEVVSPAEGTHSPQDQFELGIVLDRFSHRFHGKEVGHGVISLENRPTGRPVVRFTYLKDHLTPTGGHLAGTYQFQPDGSLWLTTPDTSVRLGAGVQPNKILKLAKSDDQRVDSPNRPANGDSQRSSNDPGVVYKYPASATTELKSQYDTQERVVRDLAQRVRNAPADGAGVAELKNSLTAAVYRAFALRQQLNRVELKELEERLARSRLAIETREKIRDQVVERRVNDLLNPEFQWDDRRTTIDSAKSTRDADHPDVLNGGTVRTNESVPAATGRALIESEYRLFEGEWQIISEDSAGKVTQNPRETRNRFVVKDGRMEGAEFVLNPSATPRQIDLRAEVGPKLYKSIRGIYEWVDRDQDPTAKTQLRIRIPNPESKDTEIRPNDFEQAGNFHTIVLERASTDHATLRPLPRVSDEADPKLQSEYRAMDGRWRLLEYSKDFEVLKVSDTERIVTIQGEKIDEAPFSLDLSKSPRQIDLKVKSGEETKWKTVRGIYRWEESPVPKGRRLRIAMRYPAFPESNSRPTDFLPTKEVNMTLLEWIGEIQPDESAPSSAPPIPDATAPSTFKTPEPADPKRP